MYFISGEFCSRDLHCSSELCTMLWNFLSQILLMIQDYEVPKKCTADLHCNSEPLFCESICQGEVAEERRFMTGVGVGRKRLSKEEEEMTNYKSAAAAKQVF